jgi:hypothetical protein
MIKVTYTSIKTNADSLFFAYDDDLQDLVKNEFIDTGKIIDVFSSLSDDELIRKENLVFNTENDFENFKNHEVIMYAEKVRLLYNIHHRIDLAIDIVPIS